MRVPKKHGDFATVLALAALLFGCAAAPGGPHAPAAPAPPSAPERPGKKAASAAAAARERPAAERAAPAAAEPPGKEAATAAPPVVTLEGNENISSRLLKRAAGDALLLLSREGKKYHADDAAYAMEEYCRGEGYHAARVDFAFDPGPPVRVRFRLREGPRAVLGKISLKGRGDVPREALTPFFAGKTTGWIGGKRIFVRSDVENAARLIRDYYRSKGFLRAKVDPPEITFREKGTKADVAVTIHPGPRYTIREVRFEGAPPGRREELLEALGRPAGAPYTPAWRVRAAKKIEAALRKLGHPFPKAGAKTDRDDETGGVRVLFSIEAGKVRRVRRVLFEGRERTRESFLRSIVAFAPGDVFDGDRVEETVGALYATALFDRVRVKEIPAGEDGVDIAFRLEERASRNVDFLAGYGSYEMARGAVTYTDRNFLGRGLKWSSALRGSLKSASARTSLTDPRFLGLPVSGTAEAYTEHRKFPSFTSSAYGGVASLSKAFGSHLAGSTGYSLQRSLAANVDPGVEATDLAERATLGTLFTRWVLDFRDSKLRPRRGTLLEVKVETADRVLGSDLGFNRITARTAGLVPLEEEARWILALGARAGVIFRKRGTAVIPVQERFFNGGEDSVRSFREHDLGPKVNGDPVGGEFFSTINVELRAPLYGRLRAALFADGGNVLLKSSDMGFRDYRFGLGAGLRYGLPIGPVRLDFGWKPDRRRGEVPWVLHLSVGYAF